MRLKKSRLGELLANDGGAAAIEYVIMACILGLMLLPTTAFLAAKLQVSYDRLLGWF